MNSKVVSIIGVHQKIEGYPNVLYLIDELEHSGSLNYKEYNIPMWSGSFSSKKNIFIKIKNLIWSFYSHSKVLYYIFKTKELDKVYIPYPAIFITALIALIPKSRKPRLIVIDAFISIYDTAILDRRLFSRKGLVASILKSIERFAFKQADIVITDTHQNSLHYSKLFKLPMDKFRNIPLSTNEMIFHKFAPPLKNDDAIFNVVFIGTLIPLHGIETILDAAKRLSSNPKIQFTIIGDGQMSKLVQKAIDDNSSNIKWLRRWHSSEELYNQLSKANLALGIFGTGDKTQRVCPFKLYAYMACGLPIVTGETRWSIDALKEVDYSPFLTVAVGNSEKLVDAIIQCYKSVDVCNQLALNSNLYYKGKLANIIAVRSLESVFIKCE